MISNSFQENKTTKPYMRHYTNVTYQNHMINELNMSINAGIIIKETSKCFPAQEPLGTGFTFINENMNG